MEKIYTAILGSGKHAHLSKRDLLLLFGEGAELQVMKWLGEGKAGQFVSDKKVELKCADGSCMLTVLGPLRSQTQVEVSYTEGRALGVRPPLSDSGKLEETMGCTLTGPAGSVTLSQGLMVVRRHIHINPEEANKFGIRDKELVDVHIDGPRGLIFKNCLVRLRNDDGRTVMHLDFDEMNAAGLSGEAGGWIEKG